MKWNNLWVVGVASVLSLAYYSPVAASEVVDMTVDEASAHLEPYFEAVVDAIYLAEGGAKAKKPYGILSVPCSDKADCRKVCLNTVRNNYRRWVAAGRPGDYIEFLGARYAPTKGATNDPRGLNNNWVRNVKGLMG